MKKFGFTLAEVLITLGIIGVVAALTAPALVTNTGTAKVGPTLSKTIGALEVAHEHLMLNEAIVDLRSAGSTIDEYFEKLSKYVSGCSYATTNLTKASFTPALTKYDKTAMDPKAMREFKFSDNISLIMWLYNNEPYEAKGSYLGQYAGLYIDINGINSAPNIVGKDIFGFYIDRSGQIIPWGSSSLAWLRGDEKNKYSSTTGNYACNQTTVTTGYGCAGSIFENDLKVIYQ